MPTITVLVHSFNRPRMLGEALASVAAARPDQIIVVDDGSDFDVAALARRYGAWLFVAPAMTVAERMGTPRQGMLINCAMGAVTSDICTSLCDDDLHAATWYDDLRDAWMQRPDLLLVRGDWLTFDDGTTPQRDNPACPWADRRRLTAGNFAWSTRLVFERGCAWPEGALNCLDNGFLVSLHSAGADMWHAPTVGFAGWRRKHAYTNLHWSDGSRHTAGFRAVLERGALEP